MYSMRSYCAKTYLSDIIHLVKRSNGGKFLGWKWGFRINSKRTFTSIKNYLVTADINPMKNKLQVAQN